MMIEQDLRILLLRPAQRTAHRVVPEPLGRLDRLRGEVFVLQTARPLGECVREIFFPGFNFAGHCHSSKRYFASVFHMSRIAFQLPSDCFCQTQRNLPFSDTRLPSAPLYEASYVPAV